MNKITTYLIALLILGACSSTEEKAPTEKNGATPVTESPDSEAFSWDNILDPNQDAVVPLDEDGRLVLEKMSARISTDFDISKLSLQELRLLRSGFAARQGEILMEADLRGIFETTSWYSLRMESRFWAEDAQANIPRPAYSVAEKDFIEKITERIKVMQKQNYVEKNGRKYLNTENIVNRHQLEQFPEEMEKMIAQNGFAIVPNTNIQFFHLYEKNDYEQFPSFITTDMYLQLFHMYFGKVLRTLEEERFIGTLAGICKYMNASMGELATVAENPDFQDLAEWNQCFWAIAFKTLTAEDLPVPSKYRGLYQEELQSVNKASNKTSEFLEFSAVTFPYSLFKPRGHYTRNEALKRYFKCMMWLQTAPFCLNDDRQFRRAIMNAQIMAGGLGDDAGVMDDYFSLFNPISFLIGEPDNMGFQDLVQIIADEQIPVQNMYTDGSSFDTFKARMTALAKKKNTITPKNPMSCIDRFNFMPQRYLADNQVLQEMVDTDSPRTKRALPSGLDVLAAFGSTSARNVLLKELKVGEQWEDYRSRLTSMEQKMKGVDWNATVYNKWIESLLRLQEEDSRHPWFMTTPAWEKKDLNTSLASWAELKHDAILYAEQPMGAECGGAGPPPPITFGYVEPNLGYWNAAMELLNLTEDVMKKYDMESKTLQSVGKSMRENLNFFIQVSEKELAGKRLEDQEYERIEYLGSTFEWLTIDLVSSPDMPVGEWKDVKGPDRSVAVIADVYTANAMNNPDKSILHVGTGLVNDIYVPVEINGFLFLTKGAVFSYYEFGIPLGNRLTDEEWQEMLDNNQNPDIPEWIKQIILPIETPKSNEKIFYSSGC